MQISAEKKTWIFLRKWISSEEKNGVRNGIIIV